VTRHDVVVLGGGPAALAAASACAQVGLSVARVDAAPGRVWPNTYGVWVDQLEGHDLEATLAHRWDEVEVVAGRAHRLGRSYGVFDNAALMSTLASRAVGVDVVEGRVVGANHDRWQSTAVLHDGRFLDAAVLVDATGHWPVLVHRADRGPRARQLAHGVVARCSSRPFEAGCVLMDWSATGVAGEGDDEPTFLYALELGEGWWLLEETALATRTPVTRAELEARLRRRLAARGVSLLEVRSTEEVDIPLGLPVPNRRQRAVGIGGSASLVHPATGYSVGATFQAAARLATAVAQALERRATPEGASLAAWAAVWPVDRRRARAMEEFGLSALLRLDRSGLEAFFDTFFALDDDQWFGYLTGTLSPRRIAGMMRDLFAATPSAVRSKLVAGNPLALVRALA
jgi:lycopene cyclase-like protein